jgi:hypothetical protein
VRLHHSSPLASSHLYLSKYQLVVTFHRPIRLTRSTLFDLLRPSDKNRDQFNHDFNNGIGHRFSWSYFSITLKPFEELFYTLEQIGEHTLTCIGILSPLAEPCLTVIRTKGWSVEPTKRRTPIPTKITFAGESTYIIDIRVCIKEEWSLEVQG